MHYFSYALPLVALASGALANPVKGGSCVNNACLAAVTGKAALGDGSIRASHCASYLATTVTPIVTETVTITGSGKDNWKRSTVALCPNEVPNYASACDDAAYTSACACFGFTEVKTTTIAPTTTTKTIWVKPTGGAGTCSSATVTKTGTVTVVSGSTCPAPATVTSTSIVPTGTCSYGPGGPGGPGGSSAPSGTWATTTVTVSTCSGTPSGPSGDDHWSTTTVYVTPSASVSVVTVYASAPSYSPSVSTSYVTVSGTCTDPPASSSSDPPATSSDPPSACVVDDALATTLVNNFVILLEYTSYNGTQGAPGRGYQQNVSDVTLDPNFSDISDSINFMAGFQLGSVTFPTKAQFDYGQGVLQPEVAVNVLNIWHDCNSITWRWRITSTLYPVNGINYMEINSAGLIQKNYAEFDNGAWLQSFGQQCAIKPVSVADSVATKRGLVELDLDLEY